MDRKIEEAFASATKILFGKPLSPIGRYEKWLLERTPAAANAKSALGKGSCYMPDYSFFGRVPRGRLASKEEFESAGKMRMQGLSEASTLAQIANEMKKFAYFVPDYSEGSNVNVQNSTGYFNCMNIANGFDIFDTKNSGNVFSVLGSEAVFGCYRILSSKFIIHCYEAYSLNRCFEMDYAKNCNDSMFCHNVESLDNCMFCFNVKGKRYAIANCEVGREEYLRVKKIVVDGIVAALERDGKMGFDVYNVLGKGK